MRVLAPVFAAVAPIEASTRAPQSPPCACCHIAAAERRTAILERSHIFTQATRWLARPLPVSPLFLSLLGVGHVQDFTHGPLDMQPACGGSPPSPGQPNVTHGWANHGAEQVFVFGDWATGGPCDFSPPEQELSATIQRYWTSFAHTGDPNA